MILLHRLRATNFKQIETIDLTFPQSGTLLIEGRNEAGKSTLFEAIFYALYGVFVGDTTAQEAIRYSCEFLEVTLDFSVEGRGFSVTRRQGARATASLTFPNTSGELERVVTVTGVNKQIAEELNLSAQGLLNTCFVEQKKLEHLESLNPSQRQAAINELVNLSAFDRILKGFPSDAEERRLESAARLRLTIARLDAQLVEWKSKLEQLRPLYAVAQLSALETAQEACRQTAQELALRKAALSTAIRLKERSAWLRNTLRPALDLWNADYSAMESAQSAVTQAESARGQLPSLARNVAHLTALSGMLTLYWQHHEEQERHSDWAASQKTARDEITRLEQALQTAEARWKNAIQAQEQAEKHLALTRWATAKTDLDSALSDAPAPEQTRLEKVVDQAKEASTTAEEHAALEKAAAEKLESHARALGERNRKEIQALQTQSEAPPPASFPPAPAPIPPAGNKAPLGMGLMALGAVLGIAAFVTGIWLLLAPAIVLLGGGGTLFVGNTTSQKTYQEALRLHQESEQKAQTAARQAQESARTAWEQARQKITQLQTAIDQATEDARAARETATEQADLHRDAIAALSKAKSELADYRVKNDRSARIPVLQQTLQQAQSALQGLSLPIPTTVEEATTQAGQPPALPHDVLRRKVREAQEAHSTVQTTLRHAETRIVRYRALHEFTAGQLETVRQTPTQLKEAGFPLEPDPLAQALRQAERAQENAQRLVDSLPDRQGEMEKTTQNCNRKKEAFQKTLTDFGYTAALPETISGAGELLVSLQHKVQEKEAQQDAALRTLSLEALQQELAELSRYEGANLKAQQDLESQEAAPRQTLGLPALKDAPLPSLLSSLKQTYPTARDKDAAQWREEIRSTEEAQQANRVERNTHASTAQIPPEPLDLVTERIAYEKCLFSREVNTQAKRILSLTRDAILNRVMPSTLNVTRRILPLLTEYRYRDVEWNIDSNLLKVMDSRKGDWAAKKVFSGGTRDQISLALRLSFVLATLPNHKATRPGWLFLDEPLSSFDTTRSENLVKLLTSPGSLIRPKFPQIFLISHGVAADPSRFDYHLVMDGGKISPVSRLPNLTA